MPKKYIGKNRAQNLEWLMNVWLREGPPVCFLQGFPGVGKTDLARDFRELAEKQGLWQQAVINEIADRATPSVLESLMELSVTLSQQGMPEMEQVLFEQTNPNPAYALEKALQRPVLIILDEAQRFFREDSGAPLPEMNSILTLLRNRPTLRGRLLLLSDRVVEEARWSEWIPKRTLARLEPDEALEALESKLRETGVSVEIPPERKVEVVRDLDFNPRAIEALVGALRYDTLDEIIESNPGLWTVRDREISRDFLKGLERDLLERTMRHLDDAHQLKLWCLAVHRRSFKRQALERLCRTKNEAAELRGILVTRYLVNFYRGALALNPIVREISLTHLRDVPAEFRQAHSGAADYHLRHFKAQQIVGTHSKLGESFAELRYHLVQAWRQDELRDIGHRFTDHLKREIKSVTPVPTDREELDERIGVLTVLLESGGAMGLEYHLARCLQSRGKPGDIQQAVVHAERALGPRAPESSWYLLAKLKRQAEGADASVAVIRRGLNALSDPDVAAPLYQLGGEILAEAGRSDEAVALLKEGIKVIPPARNLFSLYQSCADLLAHAGKSDEAVALLKDGIQVIPPAQNLFSLYQSCADLLAHAGKSDEAVALLKDGIQVIPPDKGLFSLYEILGEVFCRSGKPAEAIAAQREGLRRIPEQFNRYKLAEGALYLCVACDDATTLAELLSATGAEAVDRGSAAVGSILQRQMQGDWRGAGAAANTARGEFPHYFALAAIEAFSRLAAGDAEGAWRALASYPNLTFGPDEPHVWLAAFIHLRRGKRSEASTALAHYLGRPIDESREVNEVFLLRLWDEQETGFESSRLCFHFPLMPASLTGLSHAVRRLQFAKSVLPVMLLPTPGGVATAVRPPGVTTPEVYVSYAWGEDSTEEGRRREEIVDRLCEAVRASGREIGRDKERLRGGDSIERFAHDISRARRIVAVISEKSLHSDFCMAHELFRAYRRCDYQRSEFQEKVVALVMDDAKPLLKDELALVRLAESWKQKFDSLHKGLQSVDPHRRNHDLWVFVDLMEDMVPRLPGMLAALRDIVMKRGFDDIVRDGFQEVIRRLPPEQH